MHVTYKHDPEACAIGAFSISWNQYSFYTFPPFGVIPRILQEIQTEKATGLIVIPKWPTQLWWPRGMRVLMQEPVQLPKGKKILKQPSQPDLVHPLHQKLVLLLCHASGDYSKTMVFQAKLPNWSGNHGEKAPGSSITLISNDVNFIVVKGKLIQYLHL